MTQRRNDAGPESLRNVTRDTLLPSGAAVGVDD